MINIREQEYLVKNDEGTFVCRVSEWWLFNKWRFKTRELHSYNQKLIQEFTIQKVEKKPIGFKTNNKTTKKKKKNEDKSKTN